MPHGTPAGIVGHDPISARLSELALETTRQAVEDCVSATKTGFRVSSAPDLNAFQSALGQPVLEKALAYSCDAFQIVARAQAEAAQVMFREFSLSSARLQAPDSWSAAVTMFNRGVRDLSAMSEANLEAAVDARAKMSAGLESLAKHAA